MGMYDESWCASCGAGMHYRADKSAECGKCMLEQTQEITPEIDDLIKMKEEEEGNE
jgi:hypothetical protein